MPRGLPRHKLTAFLRTGICKFIEIGVSQEAAAASEGVGRETYYGWMRRGRAARARTLEAFQRASPDRPADAGESIPDETLLRAVDKLDRPFVELVLEVEKSIGKAEAGYTMHVAKAASRDWRAAAWWLEKRRGDLYGGGPRDRGDREPDDVRDPARMSNQELIAELSELGFVQVPVIEAPDASAHALEPSLLGSSANDNNVIDAEGGDDERFERPA